MAFNPGITFSDGTGFTETATSDTLHALIVSGTASGVTAGEHSAGSFVIFRSATAPAEADDQGDGTLWFDETSGLFKRRLASGVWTDYISQYDASNDDTVHIPKGAVLAMTDNFTVERCATAVHTGVVGVAMSTLATGGASAFGSIKRFGFVEVQLLGEMKPGWYIAATTTAGALRGYADRIGTSSEMMGSTFAQGLYCTGPTFQGLVTVLMIL